MAYHPARSTWSASKASLSLKARPSDEPAPNFGGALKCLTEVSGECTTSAVGTNILETDYEAARSGAGVTFEPPRGRLRLTGKDAIPFLHRMLTNDIQRLSAGQGCYAALLSPNGRMISDMRVIRSEDVVLLDTPSSAATAVKTKLEQFLFREDVRVSDLTDSVAFLGVHGPDAASIVARLTAVGGETLDALNEHHAAVAQFNGSPLQIIASRVTGEKGFDLSVHAEDGTALRGELLRLGCVHVSSPIFTVMRIEAGFPLFPDDMDSDTIPLEAGIEDRAVSQTKGCYPGQEIVTRVLHRGGGRLARKLVGIAIEGNRALDAHALIRKDNNDIGRITSAGYSPGLGRTVALGYVRWELRAPGTEVEVHNAGEARHGVVAALPFLDTAAR